ncbi:MAG: BirA family biotin operon repressor/biotin-[acetyl-CoA-carboxylase] ligase [Chlamydiales bacterium]|jgi:BirA family biotin operon repressor/biotin-[acetyl-CoA-carboxylase] ligase
MEFRRIDHGVVDSTNERAFAQIADGSARHGDVHVARGQTQGRGRRGRTWFSEPGQGLYLSLVLLPQHPLRPAALTVATGLALLDLAHEIGVADARLKWPNDLIVGDAKLAGILVETRGFQQDRPHYIVGVGLNVLQVDFPDELLEDRDVTSLGRLGCEIAMGDVEQQLLATLSRRIEQVVATPEQLQRDYPPAAGLEGRTLRVETSEGQHRGLLTSFDFEHGLTVETSGGSRRILLEHVRQVVPLDPI